MLLKLFRVCVAMSWKCLRGCCRSVLSERTHSIINADTAAADSIARKEEGSSATDSVTDLTDGRRKFGNEHCTRFNGWTEAGRRKRIRKGITRILTRIHGWVFLLITNYRQHYTDFDTDTRMGVF